MPSTPDKEAEEKHWFISTLWMPDKAEFDALHNAMQDGNPALVDMMQIGHTTACCRLCGHGNYEAVITDGKQITLLGKTCTLASGVPLLQWELNVPSGYLRIGDNLSELFPLPGNSETGGDAEAIIARASVTREYAANGLARAYVGHTAPSVYHVNDEEFKIANNAQDGSVITTIKAENSYVCIADATEYWTRKSHFKLENQSSPITVAVKPGVYLFTHSQITQRPATESEVVFTTFKWIRPPDPRKDYLAQWTNRTVNPAGFVRGQARVWPTLYGSCANREDAVPWDSMTSEAQRAAWQSVGNHIFFTIGSGTDWDEKGYPLGATDEAPADEPIPQFRSQEDWYPFSIGYGGWSENVKLAPGFQRLLLNMLESIISFGMNVYTDSTSRYIENARKHMQMALVRYRELLILYPNQATGDYARWAQKPCADEWIKNFHLGPLRTLAQIRRLRSMFTIPHHVYGVIFDATKRVNGNFAWHPKQGGAWARKEDAKRWAPLTTDAPRPATPATRLNPEISGWGCYAKLSIPLRSIARIHHTFIVDQQSNAVMEVMFDYGSEWMRSEVRKGLNHWDITLAFTLLTETEYKALLPEFVAAWEKEEAEMEAEMRMKEETLESFAG